MTCFSCPTALLPGYPVSITVGNAIKNRASNEEILTILKEVPNPNQEDDDGSFFCLLFCIGGRFLISNILEGEIGLRN